MRAGCAWGGAARTGVGNGCVSFAMPAIDVFPVVCMCVRACACPRACGVRVCCMRVRACACVRVVHVCACVWVCTPVVHPCSGPVLRAIPYVTGR